MIKDIRKTKKKVIINGETKKVDYEVFLLIRNQDNQLMNHIAALCKYVQIHDSKKKHTEDEIILYEYCMQLEGVTETLEHIKKQTNEKENNSKS